MAACLLDDDQDRGREQRDADGHRSHGHVNPVQDHCGLAHPHPSAAARLPLLSNAPPSSSRGRGLRISCSTCSTLALSESPCSGPTCLLTKGLQLYRLYTHALLDKETAVCSVQTDWRLQTGQGHKKYNSPWTGFSWTEQDCPPPCHDEACIDCTCGGPTDAPACAPGRLRWGFRRGELAQDG